MNPSMNCERRPKCFSATGADRLTKRLWQNILDVVVENDDFISADILLTDLNVQANKESTKTGYTALMLCSEFAALKMLRNFVLEKR